MTMPRILKEALEDFDGAPSDEPPAPNAPEEYAFDPGGGQPEANSQQGTNGRAFRRCSGSTCRDGTMNRRPNVSG